MNINNEISDIKYSNSTGFIKIIEYLFIICTILKGSTYLHQLNHNNLIINVLWQLSLVILFLISFIGHKCIRKDRFISFIMIFLFITLIASLFYYIYYPYPIQCFILLVIDATLLITYFFNISHVDNINISLFRKFENVMVILACISLIFYIIYLLGFHTNSITFVHWGVTTSGISTYPGYFNIDFFPNVDVNYKILGINTIRNIGMFIEAPTYSYYLLVAILTNLFLDKNKCNYKLIILSITIITTFSTTGITLLLLSLIFYQLFFKKTNLMKELFTIILVPSFILGGVMVFINKKDSYSSSVNSSYNIRHDDMLASLHAWSHHLIIGNGINNNGLIYEYMNPLRFITRGDIGITMGLFAILAYGGIVLLLYYLIPTIISSCVSLRVFCFAIFNFIVLIFEGIMISNLYIMVLSFLYACYLTNYNKNNIKV